MSVTGDLNDDWTDEDMDALLLDWRRWMKDGFYAVEVTSWEGEIPEALGYVLYMKERGRLRRGWRGVPDVDMQVFMDAARQRSRLDDLRQIFDDPTWHMAEYGHATGRCGVCNHRLRDEQSRLRGIGPKCIQGFPDVR